ncbi:dolichyl-diphospho-oligosaccharide-protein glycosyltransferase [Schizosaccharomyces japonicus yFS275]|uniref:Dolichyl-diphosphooligosaccharide--protein glycosyltransferase subunit 1 n=1 Tax=Schizosaccharomyces japonicus (strain yFS275 / FY16936) TaxID=402676 RepID=B6JX81_SCHJY|nr:dolichyl-diphospho-oligosaccharide-protein glycosyltransferase [Schizosaccharomyces japonicus yFS275]EEB05982.1 dolichyl-diphospho-oligosaccharide-protein glycosyltransferase [Schizosaccharomyces japonicus yFS275]
MWSLRVLVLTAACGLFSSVNAWKNTNLIRTYDLTKSYVKETITIKLENDLQEAANVYTLMKDLVDDERVVSAVALEKTQGGSVSLDIVPSLTTEDGLDIRFPSPVLPGESKTIHVSLTLDGAQKPVPAKIKQDDQQYLVYRASKTFVSPYDTEKQRLKFKFPTNNVPSFTEFTDASGNKQPARAGNTLTYETLETVERDTPKELVSVRYEYTAPLPRARQLDIEVDIHQFRKEISVVEKTTLENHAAELRGHFNRAKWAMSRFYNPLTAALGSFRIYLPKDVRDVSFKDEDGNVTTSHMRADRQHTVLDLIPRFPVFGGWNYYFRLAWNMALDSFAADKNGRTVVTLPSMWSLEDALFSNVSWTLTLPEGAKDIKVNVPTELSLKNVTTVYHFLDIQGRQSFVYEASDVSDEFSQKVIEISYVYDTLAHRLRLAVIVGIIGVLFTAAYMIWAP